MTDLKRFVKETLETLIVAFLIALFVRAFFFQVFYIPSSSMVPTLDINDRIIVDRISGGIPNPLFDMNDSPVFLFDIPNPLYNTNFPLSNIRNIVNFRGPKRFDVIVFKYPKDPLGTRRDFIKRLIGLPGERIKLVNGTVYVNGKALVETHTMNKDMFNMDEREVPKDCFFMMGDNRPDSADSRYWGFVPRENIIGHALIRIWPLTGLGLVH